jgi:hypothetical protein
MPTLLDIAKINLSDDEVGLIEEAIQISPEITGTNPVTMQSVPNVGDAKTIPGINYYTLVRTAVPTGGSFRKANDGVDRSKSTYENRLVETYIFDKRFEADKAVADRDVHGWSNYLAMEASGVMEGGIQDLSKQFYYGTGTGGDAAGFPGLIQAYDTADMVVDAGGTTDDTASSAWFVKFGVRDVRHVVGKDGMFEMGDVRIESITGENSKRLDAYVQTLLFYPGLQVGNRYSVLRIKKLTADSGKGLTDALLGSGLSKFMDKRRILPDVIFCTHRSLEQLRASRTATTTTGAEAPTPTSYEGVPILPTGGITNTEKLAL